MPCYLVTGAAGFIASKVCELLLAAGQTVVGVDNLNDYYDVRLKDYRLSCLLGDADWQSGDDPKKSAYLGVNRETSSHLAIETRESLARVETVAPSRFIFRCMDIEDMPRLDALFREFRFDAVFNLAARAGVRYSMENPFVYLSTNTLGTLNILECQRKYDVKKQVLASTSSLYAGCPMPFTEEQAVNTPLSPYAATKKAAELMAYSYHKLYGLHTTVVRYFTVFGPAGRPDMSIFRFIKQIDEEKPLELYGDGSQSRDFTYVDDIARGTVLAAQLGRRGTVGERREDLSNECSEDLSGLADSFGSDDSNVGYNIINLGGGRKPISLLSVIAYIEKALGKKATINAKPFHAADLQESWADINKARTLLGWHPRVCTDEGFKRAVEWYCRGSEWLKKVTL